MLQTRKRILGASTFGGLAALLLLALPTQVSAQRVARSETKPQRVLSPGAINTDYSRVYIHVGKTGFGHEHGVEGRFKEGEIHLGAAKNAGRMVFAMTSFTADTPNARKAVGLTGTTDASTQAKVNANMRGSDVLDVDHYPTATWEIHSTRQVPQEKPGDPEKWELSGDFTLHGVTRPLRITTIVETEKGWLHIRGAFAVLQSKFGMKPYTKALGAIGVADQLRIYGDVWAAPDRGLP